jgi:hypothetical protein
MTRATTRRIKAGGGLAVAAATLVVGDIGTATADDNPPPRNIGWMPDGPPMNGARAYFDGDANGEPGMERIVVQDAGDGTGAIAVMTDRQGNWLDFPDYEPDGKRQKYTWYYWPEGQEVQMKLCRVDLDTYEEFDCSFPLYWGGRA